MDNAWIDASTANMSFVEELYTKYNEDPSAISPDWRSAFSTLERARVFKPEVIESQPSDLLIFNVIQAYRTYGHLLAKINPIATHEIEEPWQLKLETLGFTPNDLSKQFPTGGLLPTESATLQQIIDALKSIYCDKIGVEYMGLQSPQLEKWLQEQIEPVGFKINLTIEQKRLILQQLNRSELLETFIHTRYPGQKRFSLEGGETLIPMLEEMIETGSKLSVGEYVIGMAHRGRINVLSNILNKSHAEIFSEFEEGYIPDSFEGSGDVKYHKGFSSEVQTTTGSKVKIALAPNPSHLESVDPVVEGQVRARQVLAADEACQRIIPVLIHGDAALAGQGVVYETMQFYRLPGYATGGTLHFVINNQIGFTASDQETRSTQYCTDIARAFDAPVFHVNAEDPEGCVYATILAIQLRQKFHCDVFLDLYCYRKYGHNEGDEPAYTQPLEYKLIRQKPPIREIYRDQLISQGVVEKHIVEELEVEFTKALHAAQQEVRSVPKPNSTASNNQCLENHEPVFLDGPSTKVSKETLHLVAERICTVPTGFSIHPKLSHLLQERLSMVTTAAKPIDWGMAELLAYGSLLWEGRDVRLSGQDCCRGTFSHRHAVWLDQMDGKVYSPLKNLKNGQGRFDVFNSPLSEYGVMGFEFGYSIAHPDALVIWEAQFGDFSNGAQIVIDQYITPSEQKWGQRIGLTLFLPHGYEGQGPEHSSGRMERFLTLAGESNMRIVNPSTPAQMFHLLRRQVLSSDEKPLIIFTPKGLLRLPACVSCLSELTEGTFSEILDDPTPGSNVKRLVFCSGRVYYDLIAERAKAKVDDMAIVRIEQLYPLHKAKLQEVISHYPAIETCFWAQEEPSNMGAWDFIRPLLRPLLPKSVELKYNGRKRSASPAVGSYAMHKKQYAALMAALFESKRV